MKFIRIAVAALFVIGLTQIAVSSQDKTVKDLNKRADELRALLEENTGFKFKSMVGVGLYSKEDLKNFLLKELNANLSKRKTEMYEKIGYKFGFYPKDFDLMATYVELLTDSIAGFYHPRSRELKLVKDQGDQKLEEKAMERFLGVKMADVYLYHELFHGLQDQVHGLDGLKSGDDKNDDRVMACDSLIEGEASYMHFNFMFKERYAMAKREVGKEIVDPPKKHYPRYLYKGLVFPYTIGFSFVDHCIEEKGWKTAGPMFGDLPLSTEMVLHPEKYLGETRDYPTIVTLKFAKINAALGEAWTRLDDNVHGEYMTRLMFEEFKMRKEGVAAAAGWDGDRYCVWERASDRRLLGLWLSTWDSEGEAKEFIDQYKVLLGKKYEGLEDKGEKDGRLIFATKDQGLVIIERKGADVLILEGLDEAEFKAIPVIWDTMNKEELKNWKKPAMRYT